MCAPTPCQLDAICHASGSTDLVGILAVGWRSCLCRPRGMQQAERPADAVRSQISSMSPPTMVEHPESSVSLEQLVSVLTDAVSKEGWARRYA